MPLVRTTFLSAITFVYIILLRYTHYFRYL